MAHDWIEPIHQLQRGRKSSNSIAIRTHLEQDYVDPCSSPIAVFPANLHGATSQFTPSRRSLMGGAGPYIDFDTDKYAVRRGHTGLSQLPENVLRDTWARAYAWLLTSSLLILRKPFDTKDIRNYSLSKIVEFFGWYALDARRLNGDNRTMYADAVHSCIADYFCLILVLLPGVVGLVREDEFNDAGESITARILPSVEWIEDHRDVLVGILADQHRFDDVLSAAKARAFESE
ncbi:hypothetical protein FB451DRAFT_1399310 [Mycena latifolia]|nr:hypothetical protein FB451DRAFT_1399310 [Mycena latifolia]